MTLPSHTDEKETIRSAALELLRRELPLNLRLMGVYILFIGIGCVYDMCLLFFGHSSATKK